MKPQLTKHPSTAGAHAVAVTVVANDGDEGAGETQDYCVRLLRVWLEESVAVGVD